MITFRLGTTAVKTAESEHYNCHIQTGHPFSITGTPHGMPEQALTDEGSHLEPEPAITSGLHGVVLDSIYCCVCCCPICSNPSTTPTTFSNPSCLRIFASRTVTVRPSTASAWRVSNGWGGKKGRSTSLAQAAIQASQKGREV